MGDARDGALARWAEAAETLDWESRWTTLFEASGRSGRWFVGGRLNAAVNCLDRHLPDRGGNPAIYWEGEPGDRRTIVYADLHAVVRAFAAALRRLGMGSGARVARQEDLLREGQEALKRLKVKMHEKEVTLRVKHQQIANHEKPRTWKFARSIKGADGKPHLRIDLRGARRRGPNTELTYKYKLTGAEALSLQLGTKGKLIEGGKQDRPQLALEPEGESGCGEPRQRQQQGEHPAHPLALTGRGFIGLVRRHPLGRHRRHRPHPDRVAPPGCRARHRTDRRAPAAACSRWRPAP